MTLGNLHLGNSALELSILIACMLMLTVNHFRQFVAKYTAVFGCDALTAIVQMTTMTGLSSIASLSLGLSMSMSAGQPGAIDRTAKLQSQLSMIAAPNDNPVVSKLRRASLGSSSGLTPPPPPAAVDGGRASPSPRPAVKRQAALCPSPISEHPSSPLKEDQNSASDDVEQTQDGQATVMSF